MGFLVEIKNFFSEITTSSEERVNELSSAVVGTCKQSISEEQQLERLKEIASRHWTVQTRAELLERILCSSGKEICTLDLVCNYIVAIGDTVQTLLGEDTAPARGRSLEEQEQMSQSCEVQRMSIDFAKINQERLRDTLWQSFGIKIAWKIMGDPRMMQCRTTDLEMRAKDEWNRTHPMPDFPIT